MKKIIIENKQTITDNVELNFHISHEVILLYTKSKPHPSDRIYLMIQNTLIVEDEYKHQTLFNKGFFNCASSTNFLEILKNTQWYSKPQSLYFMTHNVTAM